MQRYNYRPLFSFLMLLLLSACGASNLNGADGTAPTAAPDSGTQTPKDTVAAAPDARLIQFSQDKTLCLGSTSDALVAGDNVIVVHCDAASVKQSFTLDDNGLLHLTDTLCVSAGLDPNAALTAATCSPTASEQIFAAQGNALVSSVSAMCLAPNVSTATTGTRAWMCNCDATSASQQWLIGDGVIGITAEDDVENTANVTSDLIDSKAAKPTNRATVLSTVKASTMTALAAKVPSRLKAQINNIKSAAATYNLQPQLLVAIAMQESTGGSDPKAYSNGGGMFQFTNSASWREYGTKTLSDRQNDALSVTAAANYLGFLINQHNGNLSGALREYNGPIGEGGIAGYVTQVYAKMRGKF